VRPEVKGTAADTEIPAGRQHLLAHFLVMLDPALTDSNIWYNQGTKVEFGFF
jgi:hypothetical protein